MASEWFAELNGRESGPFSSSDLRELAAHGELRRDDFVRKGRDGEWVPAIKVRGLFDRPASQSVDLTAAPTPLQQTPAPPPPHPSQHPAFTIPTAIPIAINIPIPQQTVVIQNVVSTADARGGDVLIAILLTFFFGPFGMFYSTVEGAFVMLAVDVVFFVPTFGFIIGLTHPICIIWAAIAARNRRD